MGRGGPKIEFAKDEAAQLPATIFVTRQRRIRALRGLMTNLTV